MAMRKLTKTGKTAMGDSLELFRYEDPEESIDENGVIWDGMVKLSFLVKTPEQAKRLFEALKCIIDCNDV